MRQNQDTRKKHQGKIHMPTELNTLKRALRLSEGQFSLLLARCAYRPLREDLLAQLEADEIVLVAHVCLLCSSVIVRSILVFSLPTLIAFRPCAGHARSAAARSGIARLDS